MADWPNACLEAWGLVWELTGQCPRELRWLGVRGSPRGVVDLAEHWRSGMRSGGAKPMGRDWSSAPKEARA